jgi:hypothetical protein
MLYAGMVINVDAYLSNVILLYIVIDDESKVPGELE